MPGDESRIIKRRKAMHYAATYGLDRQERIELAEMILRRDIGSWTELSEPDLVRLLDALEGYALVSHLRGQAGAGA